MKSKSLIEESMESKINLIKLLKCIYKWNDSAYDSKKSADDDTDTNDENNIKPSKQEIFVTLLNILNLNS